MPPKCFLTTHQYIQCGLDNVCIDVIHHIDDSDGIYIHIPNIGELHMRIADAVLMKQEALSGKEAYFLRATMAQSRDCLSTELAIGEEIIANWENDNIYPPECIDRAFRVYARGKIVDYKAHGNVWKAHTKQGTNQIYAKLTAEAVKQYLAEGNKYC